MPRHYRNKRYYALDTSHLEPRVVYFDSVGKRDRECNRDGSKLEPIDRRVALRYGQYVQNFYTDETIKIIGE